MDYLKPCPFCGALPKLHPTHVDEVGWAVVRCENKKCQARPEVAKFTYINPHKKAVKAWNQRADNG